MASFRLLHILTPFVVLEIYGPIRSRWGPFGIHDPRTVHFALEATVGPVSVAWTDVVGNYRDWSDGDGGPAFFEDTTYRLRVKSLVPGRSPVLRHRAPDLFRDVDSYPEDGMSAGPINFRRQVGRSEFQVHAANDSLRTTLEVFPAKIDYEQDYRALLSDVASAARGLALEYLRATYSSGGPSEVDQATNLEWITLVRNELAALNDAMNFVNHHPHRNLAPESEDVRAEKIKRVSTSVRRSISRGQGRGQSIDVPGVGRIHSVIPAVRSRESLDISEHRWLRFNLDSILARISELHVSVVDEIHNYERMARPVPQRLMAEENEISAFLTIVKRLLALPVLDDVAQPPPPGFASLTLLSGAGYGAAYQAIMTLRLGLNVEGDPIDLSVMDLHDLYETWCFIRLAVLVCSILRGRADLGSILQVEEAGIRVRLRRGERSAIALTEGGRSVIVSYNPAFPGLTGAQRPDIVLRFKQVGWPDLIVVFDAKYRLDASREYQQMFGSPVPPQDAINALHRYRDAIVLDSASRGLQRPVVKGVALFPLSSEATTSFSSSRLYEALNVLGIGALPFLPVNIAWVEDWLQFLFALSPEDLADPGPPFAGLSEKYQRWSNLKKSS